jgi:hypothetical protein
VKMEKARGECGEFISRYSDEEVQCPSE